MFSILHNVWVSGLLILVTKHPWLKHTNRIWIEYTVNFPLKPSPNHGWKAHLITDLTNQKKQWPKEYVTTDVWSRAFHSSQSTEPHRITKSQPSNFRTHVPPIRLKEHAFGSVYNIPLMPSIPRQPPFWAKITKTAMPLDSTAYDLRETFSVTLKISGAEAKWKGVCWRSKSHVAFDRPQRRCCRR